jgi:hypothetical protein
MACSKLTTTFSIWLFLLPAFNGQRSLAAPPRDEQPTGSVRISLDKKAMPAQVTSVTVALSRAAFASVIRDFYVADSRSVFRIDSLTSGQWLLQADATNSLGEVLFSGSTTMLIEAGRVIRVTLYLREATGSLGISLTLPKKHVVFHDFDDGRAPAWSGNALSENIGGILRMTSTHAISWQFEVISRDDSHVYTRGLLEFDAKFGEEGYFFDVRGHSASKHDINWAAKVDFRDGRVLVDEFGFVDTGARFEPGDWYHVKTVFDNDLGRRGRYTLFVKNLTRGEPEVLVGEFDYHASNGRLENIVQYGFGVRTLERVAATSLYIDNVRLEIE